MVRYREQLEARYGTGSGSDLAPLEAATPEGARSLPLPVPYRHRLFLSPLKLRHTHIEDASRHCVGARLKFHGDALFAARQLFGQRVFEIEKLARMNFERLRGDLFAVHQKVKGTRTPFAAAIGADQRHRLVRRRFQIKTEPAVPRGAPPLALEVAVDHPLPLQVVGALALLIVDVHGVHRKTLDHLAPRLCGGQINLSLLPLVGRIDLPVDGVALIEDFIEWNERNVLRPPEAVSLECQRRARHRLYLGQSKSVTDECGNLNRLHASQLRRAGAVAFGVLQTLLTEVARERDRPVEQREHLRVIRHRFYPQLHSQTNLNRVAALPLAFDRDVRAWISVDRRLLAIDCQRHSGSD